MNASQLHDAIDAHANAGDVSPTVSFEAADAASAGSAGSQDAGGLVGPPGPTGFGLDTPVRTGIAGTTALGTSGNFTNQDVNGLISGSAWDASSLTFSFPTAASNYGTGYSP